MKLFSRTIEGKRLVSFQAFRILTVSKTIFGKYVIKVLLQRYCDSCLRLRKQLFYLKTNKEGLFDALYLFSSKYPEFELDDYINNLL